MRKFTILNVWAWKLLCHHNSETVHTKVHVIKKSTKITKIQIWFMQTDNKYTKVIANLGGRIFSIAVHLIMRLCPT